MWTSSEANLNTFSVDEKLVYNRCRGRMAIVRSAESRCQRSLRVSSRDVVKKWMMARDDADVDLTPTLAFAI